MTPPLPAWIREHSLAGYTNVYSLVPDETRLFGTEDLYGDWDGRVLLLAKDFACSELLHKRIKQGDTRPFRHNPRNRTNKALQKFADSFRTGPMPTTCGLLYGSALAGLLRDDGKMSGSLPNRKNALDFGTRVVSFVITNMPRLRAIVCLGKEAWQCSTQALNSEGKWQEFRDSGSVMQVNGIALIAVYHPAARVSREWAERPWEVVRDVLMATG